MELRIVAANHYKTNGAIELVTRTLCMAYNSLQFSVFRSRPDNLVLEGTCGKKLVNEFKLPPRSSVISAVQPCSLDHIDFHVPLSY